MKWIVFAVWLLLPGLASAQAWTRPNGQPIEAIDKNGEVAQYTLSGTTDSAILTTTVPTTWHFDADTGADADGTASATLFLRRCLASSTSCAVATCTKVLVNSNGTGGVDDTEMGDDAGASTAQTAYIYDVTPGRYCADVTAGPTGGEVAVLEVTGQ